MFGITIAKSFIGIGSANQKFQVKNWKKLWFSPSKKVCKQTFSPKVAKVLIARENDHRHSIPRTILHGNGPSSYSLRVVYNEIDTKNQKCTITCPPTVSKKDYFIFFPLFHIQIQQKRSVSRFRLLPISGWGSSLLRCQFQEKLTAFQYTSASIILAFYSKFFCLTEWTFG